MGTATFNINVVGVKEIDRFIKIALSRPSIDLLKNKIIRETSEVVITHVKERYIKANANRPQHTVARNAELLGKAAGAVNPARPPHPSNMRGYLPLARAVIRKKIKDGYLITLNNEARTYNGKRVTIVASMLENPRPINIPLTLRRMVYEKLMRQGTGGYGTKQGDKTLPHRVLKTAVFMPRRVPVWQEIYFQTYKFTLYQTAHRAIFNHMGRLVRRCGGRIKR